jgi:hypothetical protein
MKRGPANRRSGHRINDDRAAVPVAGQCPSGRQIVADQLDMSRMCPIGDGKCPSIGGAGVSRRCLVAEFDVAEIQPIRAGQSGYMTVERDRMINSKGSCGSLEYGRCRPATGDVDTAAAADSYPAWRSIRLGIHRGAKNFAAYGTSMVYISDVTNIPPIPSRHAGKRSHLLHLHQPQIFFDCCTP